MKIVNPLLMNDWPIKRFLIVVLSFQLFFWCIIICSYLNWLEIPLIRQLVCLIYLLFIPGIVTLRILKLHKISSIEVLLYGVGLSISIIMFIGVLINTFYPLMGISNPISIVPLITTVSLIVILLCIICFKVDKNFSETNYIDFKDLFSIPALFLYLIPILTILGTYSVNFYQDNLLLLIVVSLISLVSLLIGFSHFPPKFYPLAIFSISLSLLFHRSLISMYISGWDIHGEYYYSNLVIMSSIWTSSLYSNVNAMLSVVMLPSIYTLVTNIDLTWVFKIISQVIYALVPVTLYEIFKRETNEKIGFFACLLFVSDITFYNEMISLTRQQIAELFLSLFILLLIVTNISKIKKVILLLVFSASLAVSHYGTSYVYMIALFFVYILKLICKNQNIQKLYKRLGISGNSNFNKNISIHEKYAKETISLNYLLFFVVFTFSWYFYTSTSSPIDTVIHIFNTIINTIFSEFMNPGSAQGLGIIVKSTASPLHTIMKFCYIIDILFIMIGISSVTINKNNFRNSYKFDDSYLSFSLAYFTICVFGVLIPHFSNSLNTSRIYHMSLIFLSPFCIIGGIVFLRMILKMSKNHMRFIDPLKLLSVFFVISFLLNTGFVYEVSKDFPTSVALSSVLLKEGNINEKQQFYDVILPEQDVYCAKWFLSTGYKNKAVYADFPSKVHVLYSYGSLLPSISHLLSNETFNDPQPKYIYLSHFNEIEKTIVNENSVSNFSTQFLNIDSIKTINCLYSNGFSKIYFTE